MLLNLSLILAGIFTVLGLIKRRSGTPHATTWTITWMVIALSLVIYRAATHKEFDVEAAFERSDDFIYSSGFVLGQHLAQSGSDLRVIVLVPPDLANFPADSRAGVPLKGLREGLGESVQSFDFQAITVPAWYNTRLSAQVEKGEIDASEVGLLRVQYTNWFTSRELSELMDSLAGRADVVVFNLDLPAVRGKESWPRLAVLNGSLNGLESMIRNGTIEAAVTHKPNPRSWQVVGQAPKDQEQAFRMRFVLVTKDTVAEVGKEFPGLFGFGS